MSTTSTSLSSTEMATELKAQEIRAMKRYATAAPSEEWGEEFHRKLAMWRDNLAAYELQELADARA